LPKKERLVEKDQTQDRESDRLGTKNGQICTRGRESFDRKCNHMVVALPSPVRNYHTTDSQRLGLPARGGESCRNRFGAFTWQRSEWVPSCGQA